MADVSAESVVEVEYDPQLCNWDSCIDRELKRRNLSHEQIKVILEYPKGLKEKLKK